MTKDSLFLDGPGYHLRIVKGNTVNKKNITSETSKLKVVEGVNLTVIEYLYYRYNLKILKT